MTTTDRTSSEAIKVARALRSEGFDSASMLTDGEVQEAIDTYGAECAVDEVRRFL